MKNKKQKVSDPKEKSQKELEQEFLSQLPVFLHTSKGKKLTEKQLKDFLDIMREDFNKSNNCNI